MPKKQRLKAIEVMLSAKLFEDRLVLIDTERLGFHKTKLVNEILKKFMSDKLVFLTPFECDRGFELATRNLKNIVVRNPQQLNVPDLVRSDLVFMTKQGLKEYEEVLTGRRMNYYRNRSIPLTSELPYSKYFGRHIKVQEKKQKFQEYENIIKPIMQKSELIAENELELLVPVSKKIVRDLHIN
jgi:hypothetical protein